MKIKLLGTGASEGVPAAFCYCGVCKNAREKGGKDLRTRNQALINDRYLIDFPQDTYFHSIKYNISIGDIEHAIITHAHEDHFYTFELNHRCPPFAHGTGAHPLNIYGPASVAEKYAKLDPPIDEKYVRMHQLKAFETYRIGDLDVTPLPAMHGGENMECFIYIIEDGKSRLLYGHDTGLPPREAMEVIKTKYFDCVILDSNAGFENPGRYHMNIPENIQLRDEMLKAGSIDNKSKVVITHLSHNGLLTHEQFERVALENDFIAAYDGIEIDF
ncbi:MAG TPA: MBL fold metallo-hydrolase [Candidatus Atribacteria bacterium]|nr:MBL fold metallo-hydrolase [Candidatus Atribacteria bacterium]HPT78118.1 MBL fold metallo-hydrolase [Candidatus Atribacteria bacterium]